MSLFEKFNKTFTEADREAIEEAKVNRGEEVPNGEYIAKIENMELGTTKDGRPMFKVQMRLVDSDNEKEQEFLSKYKNKKPCVFMNRVVAGTKNDISMIASVEGWIAKLEPETPVVFNGNYDDFMNDILDVAEEVENLEFGIHYDPERFNSISITDIFD